jgi:hypothetical protein
VTTVVPTWTGLQARAFRLALRMSVRRWAAHLGVNDAAVSNWERRGAAARLRYETQQLLDIELGRAPDEVRERFAAFLAELVPGCAVPSPAPSSRGEDSAEVGSASAAPGPAAETAMVPAGVGWPEGQWAGGDEQATVTVVLGGQELRFTISRRALVGAFSGMLSGLVEPHLAAPATRGAIDPKVVGYFTALRSLLVDADDSLGAGAVLPTVRVQLALIEEYRRQATGALRNLLLATQARWVEFAGWLSDDLGYWTAGTDYLGQAVSMAQEADDAEFEAYLLARQAQRATGALDEDRVVGLAQAALRVKRTSRSVRAFAAVQHARGRAIGGDWAGFQAAIAQAQQLTDGEADSEQLGSFCTDRYVAVHEGLNLLRLGRPGAAVDRLTHAAAGWPDSYHRERGLCLAGAAAGYLACGEPDQAATTALQALTVAGRTGSARVRDQVAVVAAAAAASHPGSPATKSLQDALADTR